MIFSIKKDDITIIDDSGDISIEKFKEVTDKKQTITLYRKTAHELSKDSAIKKMDIFTDTGGETNNGNNNDK